MKVPKFIEGLLPERWRSRPALGVDEELLKLFSTVSDNDNCLRAINEVLSQHLLQSVIQAGDINASDTHKLRACERMECFRMLMEEIEHARARAKEWREAQNAQMAQAAEMGGGTSA